MIVLTERIDSGSKMLAFSLKKAGFQCPCISIREDGFLPEGFQSPYGFYIYGDNVPSEEKPLFFNEVVKPKYWEIKATGSAAELFEAHHKRAKVYYAEPKIKRYVKIVDWYDEDGRVRLSDHYDRYGHRFAQSIMDENQKLLYRTYFTPEGKERIVENFQVGTIILMEEDGMKFFKDKQDFVIHFLKEKGYARDRIFINSLGMPFQISLRLERAGIIAKDMLFWQEEIREEIPGNMQMIFRGETKRIKHVVVQRADALSNLRKLPGASESMISGLGYVYDFKKENRGSDNVLIMTNSDQIEHLEDLVKALPMFTFRIAAVTEMSQKLMSMARYSNVKVFPNIPIKMRDKMMMEADYYLDINYGNEILDALEEAFLHNLIIIGFEETVHNREYVAPENICEAGELQVLIDTFKLLHDNSDYRMELLGLQWENAMKENVTSYKHLLEHH